ncbi:hypothetical protein MMC13_003414 [Lambiella insularis]|nr:hypothetical protein [Lambiella insularis]
MEQQQEGIFSTCERSRVLITGLPQDDVDDHNYQFGVSDWLSMVEYSNYSNMAQQPEGMEAPSAVEAVQWSYIQSLEQKTSRSPDHASSTERSTRPASEDDETAENSNGSAKRRKYVRKPRTDSHAPVKPLTAYARFAKGIYRPLFLCQDPTDMNTDMRKRYQERDLSFLDLAKLIGHDWQKCPADLRDLYLSNAQSEKEMYEEELKGYKNTESFHKYQEYV